MPRTPRKTTGTPLNIPIVQRFTSYPVVNIAPKPSPASSSSADVSKPATTSMASLTSTSTIIPNQSASSTELVPLTSQPSQAVAQSRPSVSFSASSTSSISKLPSFSAAQSLIMTSSLQQPGVMTSTIQNSAGLMTSSQALSANQTSLLSNTSLLHRGAVASILQTLAPCQFPPARTVNSSLGGQVSASPNATVLPPGLNLSQQVVTSQGIMTSLLPTSGAQQAILAQPGQRPGTPLTTTFPATFLAIPQTHQNQPPRFQLIRAPAQAVIRNQLPLILNNPANTTLLPNQSAFQTPLRIPLAGTTRYRAATTCTLDLKQAGQLRPPFINAPVLFSSTGQPIAVAPQFSPVQNQPPSLSPQSVRSPQTSPGQPPNLSPHTSPNHNAPMVPVNMPKLSPHLPPLQLNTIVRPILPSKPQFSPKKAPKLEPAENLPMNLDLKKTGITAKEVAMGWSGDDVGSESLVKKEPEEPILARESEDGEPEFVWEAYLEDTGALAAPPTAFRQVEYSLQSGFSKGMKLEVANKLKPDTFWVASVVMTCGPLLRLRYDGYCDDSGGDFWCDVTTADLHAIGWCAKNRKRLQPPDAIRSRHDNWKDFLVRTLTGAITAPSYLLDKETGITPIDQIKRGMRVEVQDQVNPLCVWIAKILENVGGRLLLRYEGLDSAQHDFWLFYLHYRIHPMGWAAGNNSTFKPPDYLKDDRISYSDWVKVLQIATKESENFKPPQDIFKDQDELVTHDFIEGMKLEALSPVTKNHLCPATVIEVVNKFYFIVELDDAANQRGQDVKPPIRFFSHKTGHVIFPVNWASKRGLRILAPRGWHRREFDWDEYLDAENSTAAPLDCFTLSALPHELHVGMKLEAVNPSHPHQMCASTITRIVDRIVWIHLDMSKKLVANHVVDVDSQEIFPVGWCASNHYPLKPPHQSKNVKRVAVVQPERPIATPEEYRSAAYSMMRQGNDDDLCPKIYFNHRCYSGRYLNKSRIAALPKSVGPGPVILVMKEVLSMMINTAYKSSRVLSELQLQGEAHPKMHQQVLKAKYKGKSYRAVVEIPKVTDHIDDFCRQTCVRLECCPNLVSTHLVNGESCPDDCFNMVKTTFHHGGAKKAKRKPGRPPGGHTNLENGAKKPGRKRKKAARNRFLHLLQIKSATNIDSDGSQGNGLTTGVDNISGNHDTISGNHDNISGNHDDISGNHDDISGNHDNISGNHDHNGDDQNQEDNKSTSTSGTTSSRGGDVTHQEPIGFKRKRKYNKTVPPPRSDIQTRGIKLPSYQLFERRQKFYIAESEAMKDEVVKKKKRKDEDHVKLETNPLHWTIEETVNFIKTTDCANLGSLLREHEIDGQALLLLDLATVQEHMELKFGPSIKLCHHIEQVRVAFYAQYAEPGFQL